MWGGRDESHRVHLRPFMRLGPIQPEAGRPLVDYVSLKYGTCAPRSDQGCGAPLEIQVWPVCVRGVWSYSATPDPDGTGPKIAIPLAHERILLRGTAAAWFGDWRLEIYTGSVSTVLFGGSRTLLAEAAQALKGLNVNRAPLAPLPPPIANALTGGVACP